MSSATAIQVRTAAGLPRLPDAAESLARLFAERSLMPFAWGAHDCCLWAADAVRAQVGVDPAAELRGRYANAMQAHRVVAAAGGGLEEIATAALGSPLRHPMLACAGDVGLVVAPVADDGSPRPALAVCIGAWWSLPAADELALQPLEAATKAWRVGCA